MGLSDILKKTLTTEENQNGVSEVSRDINKSSHVLRKTKSSIPSIKTEAKNVTIFTELKDETVEKIKNNPFWNEYSPHSQEKMVSKYFDNKVKREKYNGIKYSLVDKRIFIEEVLKSVV